jgi:hypothetical protein
MTTSYIGEKEISKNNWVLSLVRKFDKDHAFLILEGINSDGSRCMKQAHLFIKEDSNNKKAIIVYKLITLESLRELSEGCKSISWDITKIQSKAVRALIRSEVDRGARGEIDYVITGNSKVNGLFGDSLEQSHLDESKNYSAEKTNNAAMYALLKSGHNCYSWAYAMVKAIQLPLIQQSWISVLVKRPLYELDGQHDAAKIKSHGCTIL